MNDITKTTSSVNEAITIVADMVDRRLRNMIVTERQVLVAFILKTVLLERFYLIRTLDHLHVLWKKIRTDERHTDFVMECTNELRLKIQTSSSTFSELTINLAIANGQHRDTDESDGNREVMSALDDDLLSHLPDHTALTRLYEANPWFVFIQLLRFTDLSAYAATAATAPNA